MASGISKGVAAVPHKHLSDCRTSKCVRLKKGTRYYRATGCRVLTSTKQKFDTLSLRGESMQYCGISCHIRSSLTAETSRSGYSSSTVPANCLLTPAGCQQPSRPVACSREGERSSPHGSGRPEGVWRRHRGRSAEKSSPNASSGRPKCASARASRTGAEGARRDTMPGGGGALAAVHSGKRQAATGQHDGRAPLQPGLTCTGRTETVLSPGARLGKL